MTDEKVYKNCQAIQTAQRCRKWLEVWKRKGIEDESYAGEEAVKKKRKRTRTLQPEKDDN